MTRYDIFDYLRGRSSPWWGRLDEATFLEALYDVDQPTADNSRLAFLARTVHPEVAAGVEEATKQVEELNRLLAPDGWGLRSREFLSGRPIYTPVRLAPTGPLVPLPLNDDDMSKLDLVLGQTYSLLDCAGDEPARDLLRTAVLTLRRDGGSFHPMPGDGWTADTYEAVLTLAHCSSGTRGEGREDLLPVFVLPDGHVKGLVCLRPFDGRDGTAGLGRGLGVMRRVLDDHGVPAAGHRGPRLGGSGAGCRGLQVWTGSKPVAALIVVLGHSRVEREHRVLVIVGADHLEAAPVALGIGDEPVRAPAELPDGPPVGGGARGVKGSERIAAHTDLRRLLQTGDWVRRWRRGRGGARRAFPARARRA
ncbi:hypothetical protein [Streptomyces sp. BA2]|uniref:AbiJ-related protein n=1 Tax=Streptomyces sp. BA2 TaxID=436595 RepID=UPI001328B8B3|nr:hypothetical protein [Streptomyces sp. BA2]